MWATGTSSTFKKIVLSDEKCFCCGTRIALIPFLTKSNRKSFLCASCNKILLKEGYIKLEFNPSSRLRFHFIQIKEISWPERMKIRMKKEMLRNLCQDCKGFKLYGFNPSCKYCENDGKCPKCGERMKIGKDLKGPMWICPKGHCFDQYGREFWRELFKEKGKKCQR